MEGTKKQVAMRCALSGDLTLLAIIVRMPREPIMGPGGQGASGCQSSPIGR